MKSNTTIATVLVAILSVCPQLPAQQSDVTNASNVSIDELRSNAAEATESGNHDQAIELLMQAVKASPNDPDCQYDLAMAYYHADRMPQMWSVLHRAATKDPAHQKIANALLAYWRMFDEQGLFNVGVPVTDITRMLGNPDQTATNGKRKRLMYGFMVIETREGRGASNAQLARANQRAYEPQGVHRRGT